MTTENHLIACFYQKLGERYIKQAGSVILVWERQDSESWKVIFGFQSQQGDMCVWTSRDVKDSDIIESNHIYRIESEHLSGANSPGRWSKNPKCIYSLNSVFESVF